MTKRNKHQIDPAEEWQTGHFFVSSVAEWRAGRDVEKLIAGMRHEPYPFTVWFVPLPISESYSIERFGPKVDGAVQVASYGLS